MEESNAGYGDFILEGNFLDDHQLLYQAPKDKFNYRLIAEFSIIVPNYVRHHLHDFSSRNNKISYTWLYKILVLEFDNKYLKKLLDRKLNYGFHSFLDDFQDKNEITGFVELLAANFTEYFVQLLFNKKMGKCVFFFNVFCIENKISCSEALLLIARLFGYGVLQDIVSSKLICGKTFLHFLVDQLDNQKELENSLNVLKYDLNFFRNIIYDKNDHGIDFFCLLSQTNLKNLKFTRTVKFVLNILKDLNYFQMQMWQPDQPNKPTFLHFLSCREKFPLSIREWSEFFKFLKKNFTRNQVSELLFKNGNSESFLHVLCYQHPGVVDILANMRTIFGRYLFTELCRLVAYRDKTILHYYLLEPKKLKDVRLMSYFLILNLNSRALNYLIFENKDSFLCFLFQHQSVKVSLFVLKHLPFFNENFRPILRNILLRNNWLGLTFFQYLIEVKGDLGAESWIAVLNYLSKNYSKRTILKALKGSKHKQSFLQILCATQQTGIVQVLEHLTKLFYNSSIKILTDPKNYNGLSFLHLFFCMRKEPEGIEKLFEILVSAYGVKNMYTLLSRRSVRGKSCFHYLAARHPKMFLVALKCLLNHGINLKYVLLIQDINMDTCLHVGCFSDFQDLYSVLRKIYSSKVLKYIFLLRGQFNTAVLHSIRELKDNYSLQNFVEFLQFILYKFGRKFLRKLLTASNSYQEQLITNDILNLAYFDFQWIYQTLMKYCGKKVVFLILSANIQNGSTILHIFGEQSENTDYIECFKDIKRDFGVKRLMIMLTRADFSHRTMPALIACRSDGCSMDFEAFFRFLNENCSLKYLKEFLSFTSGNISFFEFLAYQFVDTSAFIRVLRYLKSLLDERFMFNLFTQTNDSGCQLIKQISYNVHVDMVELFEALLEMFGKEFLQQFLLLTDLVFDTFLHVLAGFNSNTCFATFLRLLIREFDADVVKPLLEMKSDEQTFVSTLMTRLDFDAKLLFQILYESYDLKK